MLTLEQIMQETIWVAKMQGYRMAGTYEEIGYLAKSEDCRDFDICATQPEQLDDFYDKYFAHNGFITIQDFYKKYYNPERPRRVWTQDEIRELVQSNDKVLYGAMRKMYECQTADEQMTGTANHRNGIGFNGVDAGIMTSFCEFLNKTGFLTYKQKVIARKKLKKYTRQLTELANM